jgi:hypothetical protein
MDPPISPFDCLVNRLILLVVNFAKIANKLLFIFFMSINCIMMANINTMKKYNIRYISAYLCSKYDHHRKTQVSDDDFGYIEEYYNQIIRLNLKADILVDLISNSFIKRYANQNIRFCKSSLSSDFWEKSHPHDIRFMYFLEHIMLNPNIEYLMLSDIRDVVVLNPIEKIIQINPTTLFVGTENEKILENKWFHHYLQLPCFEQYPDYRIIFENKTILNCGTIFGHRNMLIKLLTQLVGMMLNIYCANNQSSDDIPPPNPIDMFCLNYIVYKYYQNNLYCGDLFNTRFGAYIYDMTKVIKHK